MSRTVKTRKLKLLYFRNETCYGIWFGFTYVLFRAVVALYHVNDVWRVTVDVMSYIRCDEWSDFTCRVECVCLSLTLSLYVRPWRKKAVPSERYIFFGNKEYIFPTVKSAMLLLFDISTYSWVDPLLGSSSSFLATLVLASKIEIIRNKHG